MLLGIWLALVCTMPAPVCLGDVLFVHAYQSDEYLMGKQESELRVGYTPGPCSWTNRPATPEAG